VVRLRGDSMGDTLRDGDSVLVDTDDTDVSHGGPCDRSKLSTCFKRGVREVASDLELAPISPTN
jgi:hypothetical protein